MNLTISQVIKFFPKIPRHTIYGWKNQEEKNGLINCREDIEIKFVNHEAQIPAYNLNKFIEWMLENYNHCWGIKKAYSKEELKELLQK